MDEEKNLLGGTIFVRTDVVAAADVVVVVDVDVGAAAIIGLFDTNSRGGMDLPMDKSEAFFPKMFAFGETVEEELDEFGAAGVW